MEILEKNFLQPPDHQISFVIGARNSGKTYLLLMLLDFYYHYNVFSQFHLILPSYKKAMDKKTGKLQYERLAKRKNTYIYTQYNDGILKYIKKHKKQKDEVLFVFDDSTMSGKDICDDETFQKFIFEARHEHISMIIVTHALRKILSRAIRDNVDNWFFLKMNNKRLRQDLYEEYLNLYFENEKELEKAYKEDFVNTDDRNIWCLSTVGRGGFSRNVKDWWVMHKQY